MLIAIALWTKNGNTRHNYSHKLCAVDSLMDFCLCRVFVARVEKEREREKEWKSKRIILYFQFSLFFIHMFCFFHLNCTQQYLHSYSNSNIIYWLYLQLYIEMKFYDSGFQLTFLKHTQIMLQHNKWNRIN